jgi:hypothetical protein
MDEGMHEQSKRNADEARHDKPTEHNQDCQMRLRLLLRLGRRHRALNGQIVIRVWLMNRLIAQELRCG